MKSVGLLVLLPVMLCAAAVLARASEAFEQLAVGESPSIRGSRGVFATRPFARGEVVERCPVVLQSMSDVSGTLRDYVFGIDDDTAGVALGYGSMYNHSKNPHLTYYYNPERQEMEFVATRPIRAGEEIFVSYGDTWWKERGMKPV